MNVQRSQFFELFSSSSRVFSDFMFHFFSFLVTSLRSSCGPSNHHPLGQVDTYFISLDSPFRNTSSTRLALPVLFWTSPSLFPLPPCGPLPVFHVSSLYRDPMGLLVSKSNRTSATPYFPYTLFHLHSPILTVHLLRSSGFRNSHPDSCKCKVRIGVMSRNTERVSSVSYSQSPRFTSFR